MERRMYRCTILLVLCAAMTWAAKAPLAAGGARAEAAGSAGAPVGRGAADVATLRRIVSRVDGRTGVIAIEASDPVPYVASQPGPRLFVIELRDTSAVGFADDFTPDPRLPFAAVQVETDRAVDGESVARVRMMLAQPMRPRVRSSRNVIYVEADLLERGVKVAGAISNTGPSSAIRDVRVAQRGTATAVTLHATGPLAVSGVEESKEGPPRLLIDLPNATSALPGRTPVGAGPVNAVRIGLNASSPLVTRVVMDLTRKGPVPARDLTGRERLDRRLRRAAFVGFAGVGAPRYAFVGTAGLAASRYNGAGAVTANDIGGSRGTGASARCGALRGPCRRRRSPPLSSRP